MEVDSSCTWVLVEYGVNVESHWHPLAGDESSHGDLSKTDLGTKPKVLEPIFHSADGEIQIQSRY